MAIDFVSQIELCVYVLEAIFLIMILLDNVQQSAVYQTDSYSN